MNASLLYNFTTIFYFCYHIINGIAIVDNFFFILNSFKVMQMSENELSFIFMSLSLSLLLFMYLSLTPELNRSENFSDKSRTAETRRLRVCSEQKSHLRNAIFKKKLKQLS